MSRFSYNLSPRLHHSISKCLRAQPSHSQQAFLSYAIRGEASKLACTLIIGRVIKELPRLAQQQRELQFQLDPMRREFEHQPFEL